MFPVLQAVLIALSFIGLCAAVRGALKLNRFIAPCVSACIVITLLTFCGMLRVLKYGFFILYFGGFAGLVYAYLIKKMKPDLPLIGLFALLTGYLLWRMNGEALFLCDDFSHWGLTARYILENDRFPDASAKLITFQSYPTGSAAFIYYICRTLGNREDLWIIAQNLLHALLMLPVFALLEKNRRVFAPVAAAAFLLLFKNARPLSTLCVDWLLALIGAGMAGIVLYERNKPVKALLTVLPCLTACVFFKSSGIFFSVCTAVLLAMTVPAERRSLRRKLFAAALLISFGAFMLWSLHVKVSFPAGFDTKHAVSLSTYTKHAAAKPLRTYFSIAARMLLNWLPPSRSRLFTLLFGASCLVWVLSVRRRRSELRPLCMETLRGLLVCAILYAVWFAMLYFMYIFSMSGDEARYIAAFDRYDSTGLLYISGIALIVMFRFLSALDISSVRAVRAASLLLCILALACTPLLSLNMYTAGYSTFHRDLINLDKKTAYNRAALHKLMEETEIPLKDGCFIVYGGMLENEQEPLSTTFYCSKYELQTPKATTIMRQTTQKYADAPYSLRTVPGGMRTADPFGALSETLPDCDAILILQRDPVFEALMEEFLKSGSFDIPVFYA